MLTPEEAYWSIVDSLLETIPLHKGEALYLNALAKVPKETRHLFAAHCCIAEVQNGGFEQLFGNVTGIVAPEGLEGLEAVGMPRMAAVLRQAMDRLGPVYSREDAQRNEALDLLYRRQVDSAQGIFADLDSEFYDLEASENGGWTAVAEAYAVQHL